MIQNGEAAVKVWSHLNIHSGEEGKTLQLLHGAWRLEQKYEITKLVITNWSGLEGLVRIWDQDLSATSDQATINGSSTEPLVTIAFQNARTSGVEGFTVIIPEDAFPGVQFNAGIVVDCTQEATDITMEGIRY